MVFKNLNLVYKRSASFLMYLMKRSLCKLKCRLIFLMLESLCGSQNIQKILIFLFVNGKCYGAQLQRALKAPLTPLQNALQRLEKGHVLSSYYEGKTKVYTFNASFPLMPELEQLVKKAYTLLPAHQKKDYYVVKEESVACFQEVNALKILLNFWEKLAQVTQMNFSAKTKSQEEIGWNGVGQGEVRVTKEGDHRITFHEKGHWQGKTGDSVNFSNVFRWTLDKSAGVIALEHLRYGPNQPVFLFHLAPSGAQSLSSVGSHLCGGDTYLGHIHLDQLGLRLSWRVIGPKKNEEIDCHYSGALMR